MAGFNTRFHDVGFDIPKYLLPWGKSCIITQIITEIKKNYTFSDIRLLANQRDLYYKEALVREIEGVGLGEENIFYIGDTDGQAHTAAIGAKFYLNKDEPYCIHNADTIISGRNFRAINDALLLDSGYIDVFVANSKKYCYVRSNEKYVTEIIEKKIISPYATSGFYGFSSAKSYLSSYNQLLEDDLIGEMFVSNVLKKMLNNGMKISINELDQGHSTTVLGTPEEYGIEVTRNRLNKNDI